VVGLWRSLAMSQVSQTATGRPFNASYKNSSYEINIRFGPTTSLLLALQPTLCLQLN
jgi:hypothetical protein